MKTMSTQQKESFEFIISEVVIYKDKSIAMFKSMLLPIFLC